MNSYQPYSPDELTELEKLQQLYGQPAPAAAPAPAAPKPLAPAAYQPPPLPEPTAPLDTSVMTPSTAAPKGTALKEVKVEGLAPDQYERLQALHQQLTGQQIDAAHQSAQVEQDIATRNVNEAQAREKTLAEQQQQQQAQLLQRQQAEKKIRDEQEAWASKREDPSEAFRGHEFAGVLAAIGIAAGTFSQAMGWQNSNPVKQMFDESINRSIQAQREEKDSRLKMLTARFGDEQAAESVVRSELHQTIADKLAEHQKGIANQDTIARLAPLQAEQEAKAKASQLEAIEKLAPKQTVTNEAVKPKGPQTLEQQLKEQEAGQQLRQGKISALVEQGFTPSEAAQAVDSRFPALAKYGGQTTAQRNEAQKLAAEQEAKAKQANQMDTDEKKDLRMRLDGLANVAHGFDEIDKVGGIKRDAKGNVVEAGPLISGSAGPRQLIDATASSLPFGIGKGLKSALEQQDPQELQALRRSVEKITTGMVHAESGAGVNAEELETAGKRLPLTSAEGFKAASAEIWRQHQQTYRNLKAQYEKKGIDLDVELRARGIDPARFSGGD